MTIDEAIAQEKIESEPCCILCTHATNRNECIECRAYHKQVHKWLEELKTTRIALEKANGCLEANWKLGYQKAIDDFKKEMIRSSLTEREKEYIRYKAEQLKAGGTDE